ncbi:MAG: TerB family tellurite resistance protein [Verrucomicrobiota bacterium]
MFKNIQAKLMGGAKRMSGRTDMLEAVCAACAWTAAADGSIDDSEIDQSVKAVTSNETLNTAFGAREIEGCMERMIDRANGGRMGIRGLQKEIEDIKSNAEDAEMVLLAAMDVADADGNMDDDEVKVLEKIAKLLGLNFANYD